MKNRILQIIALFFTLAVLMMLQKPIFTAFVGDYTIADTFNAMRHGFAMDMSVAGYLTALPALVLIASVWYQPRWLSRVAKTYFVAISALIALACVTNSALYPHWGFPLETSPIFYIQSSPKAAAASEPWWVWSIGILLIALLAYVYFWIIKSVLKTLPIKPIKKNSNKIIATILLTLVTGTLFLPIRGGVTVSTMNLSRAYFSNDMRLNHAAINPLFSFLYSATHQDHFSEEFQYFSREKAEALFEELNAPRTNQEGQAPILEQKPDIILIILEGFSSHLIPSLGGEAIATQLDSIASEGLLFTNFYSNSFRTDRAIPSIICGYPAQPSTSVLKFTSKIDSLPSIAAQLEKVGYKSGYYYGGDINYTNVNALLMAGQYDKIIGDKDFPVNERMSKWGVHDEYVFQRLLKDWAQESDTPRFAVLQTSSSHEPYEVPYFKHANVMTNAFAYTDSCLGAFYSELKKLPNFDNTLVVITPDHYGSYPQSLKDPKERHRIPLVWAGGVADKLDIDSALLARPGAQTDIAATLMDLAGAPHHNFKFSHNLFDPQRAPYAYFSEPSWIAMVTDQGEAIISVDTGEAMSDNRPQVSDWLKAYLQILYLDLDAR